MTKSINLFTLLLFFLVSAVSCSEDTQSTPEPENTDHAAKGDWSGTFSGGDSGTWDIAVDANGDFTGTGFSNNGQSNYPITGSIDSAGVMTATIDVNGTILDFTGQVNGETASGTWGNPSTSLTGTWTGSKK